MADETKMLSLKIPATLSGNELRQLRPANRLPEMAESEPKSTQNQRISYQRAFKRDSMITTVF